PARRTGDDRCAAPGRDHHRHRRADGMTASTIARDDRLYNLLPAIYRERDAAEGYPLRALLGTIGEQAALVEGDIRRLYDDLFIETCRDWVIPYIGELVS